MQELTEFAGSLKPRNDQVNEIVANVHVRLTRGECVYLPLFDDAETGQTGWCFIANTID